MTLGSIPRFGASPIIKPIRHQLQPTIIIAIIPKTGVAKNGVFAIVSNNEEIIKR